MSASFRHTLGVLLKARFPILYVESFEERRVGAEIAKTVGPGGPLTRPRAVHTWTLTGGLVGPDGQTEGDTSDPGRALEAIQRHEEPAVFVFRDLHAHLGDGTRPADPAIVRRLRDVAAAFGQGPIARSLILVSPLLRIPPELEKDVYILDFALPGEEEIRAVLDGIIASNAAGGRVQVDLAEQDKDRLVKAALGLTELETEGAFARAMAADGRLDAGDIETVIEEKRQTVRKSGVLEFVSADLDLDGVGGLENLKKWLVRRDNSWLAEAQHYGVPAPKGVLITGVPGCGKSLTAKAIASAWGLPLLRLDIGRVFAGLVGSSEQNIRNAIRAAEAAAPAVLWIDEIEKGFAGVSGGSHDSGTSSRVFGTFLTWMQEKTSPVFVIATANNVRSLPPEFLRKGRFDEIFFVDLPHPVERAEIWRLQIAKHVGTAPAHAEFSPDAGLVDALVAVTDGFSGAEIEQAVIASLYDAFAARRGITGDDLRTAVERTVPLSVTQAEAVRAVRDWAATRAVAASLHSVSEGPASPTTLSPVAAAAPSPAPDAGPPAPPEAGGRRIDF